jgi:RecB family exonuclease
MLKLVEGHYRALESALPGVLEGCPQGRTALVCAGAAQMSRLMSVLGGAGRRLMPGLETFPGLPQLAARLSGRPAVRESVGRLDRILLALSALSELDPSEPFGGLAGSPRTADALSSFLEDDLLERGVDPDSYEACAMAAGDAPAVRSAGRLFRAYCGLRSACYGGTADMLARDAPGGRGVFASFVLYGFLDLNPLQRGIARRLLDSGARITFMTPVPLSDPRWLDVAGHTRSFLLERASGTSRPDASVRPSPFMPFCEGLVEGVCRPPAGFRMLEAPGPAGVAHAAAGVIRGLLAEGFAPGELAVAGTCDMAAIRSALASEGLPVRPGPLQAGSLPLAGLLCGLCALEPEDWHYSAVEAVRSCGALAPSLQPSAAGLAQAVRRFGRRGRALPEGACRHPGGPAADFLGALLEASDLVPAEAPAGEMLSGLCGAAARLVDPDGPAALVLGALPGIMDPRFEVPVSRGRFLGALPIALSAAEVPVVREPGGIEVTGLEQARGTCRRCVIVCGLDEDSLPGAARTDPRLPDEMRRALQLPSTATREAERALLLVQAAEAASERLVFIRMSSDESGAPVSWSPFIDSLVARGDFPAERPASGAADILSTRGQAPFLGMALAAESARMDASAPFGIHDGMIGSVREERSFSHTSLGAWARCPFAWMAGRLWGLSDDRGPGISPAAPADLFGRAYHAAAAHLTTGTPPREAASRAALETSMADELGGEPFAEAFVERCAGMLEALSALLRSEGLLAPGTAVERWIEGEGGGVRLTGRIDLEVPEEGGVAVFDLKTGVTSSPDRLLADAESGRNLQLPIYAHLIAREGGAVTRAGQIDASHPTLRSVVDGASLAERLPAAMEWVGRIARCISAGAFPPLPAGQAACRTCTFAGLCRGGPGWRIAPKAARTGLLQDVGSLWDLGAEEEDVDGDA